MMSTFSKFAWMFLYTIAVLCLLRILRDRINLRARRKQLEQNKTVRT